MPCVPAGQDTAQAGTAAASGAGTTSPTEAGAAGRPGELPRIEKPPEVLAFEAAKEVRNSSVQTCDHDAASMAAGALQACYLPELMWPHAEETALQLSAASSQAGLLLDRGCTAVNTLSLRRWLAVTIRKWDSWCLECATLVGVQHWTRPHRLLLGVQVMELLRARHGAVAHTLETALTDIGEGLPQAQQASSASQPAVSASAACLGRRHHHEPL